MSGDFVPLAQAMGIEQIEAAPERVVTRMPVAPNRQPAGLLAGGASAMLAESTASRAAMLHAARLGKVAVGAELNATHHAGVREGHVIATASALHLGRSSASYDVVITDEAGKRVCTARVLCLMIDRPHS
ncbi:MAG TPA: hotdog fold thioesterase [Novosphingobium sp.]|nr:hotdog fold thioesterase [Novosphingobium sp.]HZV08844.1 hotdog fold thioesterase [Novosphingobium sp.]